jgi:hypothetical protein
MVRNTLRTQPGFPSWPLSFRAMSWTTKSTRQIGHADSVQILDLVLVATREEPDENCGQYEVRSGSVALFFNVLRVEVQSLPTSLATNDWYGARRPVMSAFPLAAHK